MSYYTAPTTDNEVILEAAKLFGIEEADLAHMGGSWAHLEVVTDPKGQDNVVGFDLRTGETLWAPTNLGMYARSTHHWDEWMAAPNNFPTVDEMLANALFVKADFWEYERYEDAFIHGYQ